jgi:hypothetical protein
VNISRVQNHIPAGPDIYGPGKEEFVSVTPAGELSVEHYNPDHCCTGTATRTPGSEAVCTAADGQWCAWAGTYEISYSNGFASVHTITKDGLVSASDHDGRNGQAPWRVVRHGSSACLHCDSGPTDVEAAVDEGLSAPPPHPLPPTLLHTWNSYA